ncbi:Hypothetical predicted protein [Mytilus galloprovincialis]|uniref:Uncharacterized protein n=1 Tax=Mytilus galloprovincialis TaxID=29158 RepID=A0A8B6FJZ8_MYTGA|nr:Hypothetical predicted protein [Mytilus galloprovincialis]
MDTTNLLQLMVMVILFYSVRSFPYEVVYVYEDVNDTPYMFDENDDFGSYELSNRNTDELYQQELLPNMDSYKMYDYDESFEEKSLLHLLRDQYQNEISNIEHKRYSICGATGCPPKTGRNKSSYQKVAAKRFSVCGSKGCMIE